MERLGNIHPGEILKEEFLEPLGISAYRLAKDTFLPQTRISVILLFPLIISLILEGNRRISRPTWYFSI